MGVRGVNEEPPKPPNLPKPPRDLSNLGDKSKQSQKHYMVSAAVPHALLLVS